ncbi:MAG: GldG family protein, partial [Bacteroidota bacterium]|nr:GldG family protein [Bacteroidota bacterium]
MNKLLQHKFWWLFLLLLFAIVIAVSSFIHYRIDLTQEKRFTLSSSTKTLLKNIDTTISIKVFLTGDLPADYKKLSIATQDLLREFSDLSNNNITVSFETPGKDVNDSLKTQLYDSLTRAGVVFERNEDVNETNNKLTNQLIIPSALIYYKQQPPAAVDLRSSRTVFKNFNVVNEEPQPDKEATRNAAEALLEFKFANA